MCFAVSTYERELHETVEIVAALNS
jgi:hypothetical protein